jgi:hypothetical protein
MRADVMAASVGGHHMRPVSGMRVVALVLTAALMVTGCGAYAQAAYGCGVDVRLGHGDAVQALCGCDG